MFSKLWSRLKAPFEKKSATEEIRDNETNAIVAYQRPEEMAITRWTAQVGYKVQEDFEDAGDAIEAGFPLMGLGIMYMSMMWMAWLLLRVFTLAVKGATIGAILMEVWHLTYVMTITVLVLFACYALFTTIGVMIFRWAFRLFAKATGREKKGAIISAGNLFRKYAYPDHAY